MPLAGGLPVPIGRVPAPWASSWSDNWLVFAINNAGSSIMRIDVRGGRQPETLFKLKEGEIAFAPQVLPGGKTLLYTLTARSINRWDNARIVVQSLSGENIRSFLRAGQMHGMSLPGTLSMPWAGF